MIRLVTCVSIDESHYSLVGEEYDRCVGDNSYKMCSHTAVEPLHPLLQPHYSESLGEVMVSSLGSCDILS